MPEDRYKSKYRDGKRSSKYDKSCSSSRKSRRSRSRSPSYSSPSDSRRRRVSHDSSSDDQRRKYSKRDSSDYKPLRQYDRQKKHSSRHEYRSKYEEKLEYEIPKRSYWEDTKISSRHSERSRSRSRSRSKSQSRSPVSRSPSPSSGRSHSRSRSNSTESRSSSRKVDSKSQDRKHNSKKEKEPCANKKVSRSSSEESSVSDDSSEDDHGGPWLMAKLAKLQEEKVQKKEEKRVQKDIQKAVETPEEKRLRRLLKKEAKERKRKERMGWDKDYMHYTNTDNPFGDANLLQTFVWQKKLEKEGLASVSTEVLECRNKMKQEENRVELEKVKKRRLEREQERAQREEEMQRVQRMKEAAQFKEWEKQEDNFHLHQARLRSKIRIDDGRAKPIDLLAKYISAEDEDLSVEMHEPYTYLYGLTIRDLEDLLEDIKVYIELERDKNLNYWNDITVIVEHELGKLRKIDPTSKEHYGNRRDGINTSVSTDVTHVFKGKTHTQLEALHDNIQMKIHSGDPGIDVGYWESVLAELKANLARARLRDRHQHNLRRKLFQLKQEQGVDSEPLFPFASSSRGMERDINLLMPSTSKMGRANVVSENEDSVLSSSSNTANQESEAIITEADLLDHSVEEYDAGGYSPVLIQPEDLEPGTILINCEDDVERLKFSRQQLIGIGYVQSVLSSEERDFEMEARKGMNDDEAIFSVETQLDQKVYLWSDKYRPRKPRYFNRVHTGFEWNKYNQTHYDMDNPPPKIVQGYKFNIFYPDLIDKGVTPEYTLTPCPDNKDFAILRFHAGPPYEDIAFKIVNREWEYSYKRGFRCQFHNNIFQLWFHFKRYRYRR